MLHHYMHAHGGETLPSTTVHRGGCMLCVICMCPSILHGARLVQHVSVLALGGQIFERVDVAATTISISLRVFSTPSRWGQFRLVGSVISSDWSFMAKFAAMSRHFSSRARCRFRVLHQRQCPARSPSFCLRPEQLFSLFRLHTNGLTTCPASSLKAVSPCWSALYQKDGYVHLELQVDAEHLLPTIGQGFPAHGLANLFEHCVWESHIRNRADGLKQVITCSIN